jgi:hypothetical protein
MEGELSGVYVLYNIIKIDSRWVNNLNLMEFSLPLQEIDNKDIKGIINSYLINPLDKLNNEFKDKKIQYMGECCNCKSVTTALEYCGRCFDRVCTRCIEHVNDEGHCHMCSVELYLNYLEMVD